MKSKDIEKALGQGLYDALENFRKKEDKEMEIPKLHKITVVDVELNKASIQGNGNSLVFRYQGDLAHSESEPDDKEWELTWPEVFKACEEWADANGYTE